MWTLCNTKWKESISVVVLGLRSLGDRFRTSWCVVTTSPEVESRYVLWSLGWWWPQRLLLIRVHHVHYEEAKNIWKNTASNIMSSWAPRKSSPRNPDLITMFHLIRMKPKLLNFVANLFTFNSLCLVGWDTFPTVINLDETHPLFY